MRPVQPKLGKSVRGQWSKAQRAYADRCCEFGCIACYMGLNIAGTPGAYHHRKEGFHAGGMRAPHHEGMCLCPTHHDKDTECSVHLNPTGFHALVGMTEAELVQESQQLFNWQGE